MRLKILASLLLTILSAHCYGQEILYPDSYQPKSYTMSDGQRAVSTSTDIITIAMPAATLAGVMILGDWEGLKQGVFTAATTAGVTLLLKYTITETRPNYKNTHSFPSGHTATCFATSTFLMKRYGWKFGVPAYIMSTYVAWGRVYSRNHHWWDVAAGAVIGAGSGFLFTKPWAKKHDLQIGAWATECQQGLSASFKF